MAKAAKPSLPGWLFSRGMALQKDLIAVLAEDPKVTRKGGDHSVLYIRKQGKWGHHVVEWGAVAITGVLKPSLEVIVVGVDGDVLRGVQGAFSPEQVDDSPEGPAEVGHLRDARFIGKKVFAVGMARQAYRREAPGKWTRIDSGLRSAAGEIAGLEGVDGFSENDVYAVGLDGEIWHFDGKKWESLDSPTNVALNRVRCVPPDRVFACGAAGTLLQGKKKVFEVVEQDEMTDNLYGLEWFEGTLYIASNQELYALRKDDVETVSHGLGDGFTFGDLHADEDLLWSTGAKHLASTQDGKKWIQEVVS